MKFNVGFYGGKFLPLHKGHEYCIKVAASECSELYVVMFYGGPDEDMIVKDAYLSVKSRMAQLNKVCDNYSNVFPLFVDASNLRLSDGGEDWNAEAGIVKKSIGKEIDVVYSSEISYDDYFKKLYPKSVHRIIDSERKVVPISGTLIRNMESEEKKKWMI